MSSKAKRKKILRLRKIRRIVKTIVVLLLLFFALVWSSDWIVGKILTSQLGEYCGSEISYDSLSVNFKKGRVDARNVSVANPEGFSAQPIMSAESVIFDVNPATLGERELEVDEVCITGLNLFYERQSAGKNNFSVFVDNFSKKDASDSIMLYRVKKLRILGTRASLLINGRLNVVKIDDIILDRIGEDEPVTWDELVDYVVSHFSGIFDAEDFAVRNPEGFTETNFIKVGEFHVELDMKDVPNRRYRIRKAFAESFMLNMETLPNGRNNMQELAASLMRDEQKAKANPGAATVEIDEFVIENVTLVLSNNGMSRRLSLGRMSLKDIGKDRLISAEEASIFLLMQLNNFVNASGAKVAAVLKALMQESRQENPEKVSSPASEK